MIDDLGITHCSICGVPAHASETDDLDRCAACRAKLVHDYETWRVDDGLRIRWWIADAIPIAILDGDEHYREDPKLCCGGWTSIGLATRCTCGGFIHRQAVYGGILECCDGCSADEFRQWPVDHPHPEATLAWHAIWGWSVVQGPRVPDDVLDRLDPPEY